MNEHNPGLTYQGKRRTWGIRFSVLDAIVLIASVVSTVVCYSLTQGYSLLILFVVVHFFLFCNIFRIRRKPELIWAAIFVLNCVGWAQFGDASLLGICVSQFVVTVLIIAIELRNPGYHGIFARRINAHLDDYLSGRI